MWTHAAALQSSNKECLPLCAIQNLEQLFSGASSKAMVCIGSKFGERRRAAPCGNDRAEAQRLLLGWNDCGFVDGVEQEAVGSEVSFLGHEDDAWEHFRCAADCKTYLLTKPPPEAPSLRT
jgi:hypothetical protein